MALTTETYDVTTHGPGVSWPAIFAGTVCSLALTLVLLTLGAGLGLSSVSPWEGAGVSATTFKISAGLYLVAMAMISSAIGGFIAGRLRNRSGAIHTDEIYFRDTAHGFITWAFATALAAALAASPVMSVASSVAGGAAHGAANSAGQSSDGYLDTLLRPANPSAQDNAGNVRAEFGRLFAASAQNKGDMKPADREYMSRVVAARTGLSQPDADKRVTEVTNQAKADADAARKATAATAFWMVGALLIGALSAALAATEGGAMRDTGTWRRVRA
jgi:hypothetical protein